MPFPLLKSVVYSSPSIDTKIVLNFRTISGFKFFKQTPFVCKQNFALGNKGIICSIKGILNKGSPP